MWVTAWECGSLVTNYPRAAAKRRKGGMLHSSLCSSPADGFPAGALRLPRLGSRLVASLAKGGFVKILIIFVCGKDYSH